jgi:flagellar export protein FliJ
MKAFTFRLEQALRWRQTQVNLQKSHVAAAAARLAEIAAALEARRSDLANAAAGIVDTPTGAALGSYAGFKEKSRARIGDLEAQALVAQRALALEMNRLTEASQRSRLLENLKQSGEDRWRREFDRELAAFADEAFLCRVHPRHTSAPHGKDTIKDGTDGRVAQVDRALAF